MNERDTNGKWSECRLTFHSQRENALCTYVNFVISEYISLVRLCARSAERGVCVHCARYKQIQFVISVCGVSILDLMKKFCSNSRFACGNLYLLLACSSYVMAEVWVNGRGSGTQCRRRWRQWLTNNWIRNLNWYLEFPAKQMKWDKEHGTKYRIHNSISAMPFYVLLI